MNVVAIIARSGTVRIFDRHVGIGIVGRIERILPDRTPGPSNQIVRAGDTISPGVILKVARIRRTVRHAISFLGRISCRTAAGLVGMAASHRGAKAEFIRIVLEKPKRFGISAIMCGVTLFTAATWVVCGAPYAGDWRAVWSHFVSSTVAEETGSNVNGTNSRKGNQELGRFHW